MICEKCNSNVSEESKFCNSCGAKIEIKKDIVAEVRESSENLLKEAGLMWFTVGLIKGNCSKSKKTEKFFKEVLEKELKKNPRFSKQYDYINSQCNEIFPEKKKNK